jgi:hypothetical protein
MSDEAQCPHKDCQHPVERHTAWWGGCKYCPCTWLPPEQARGALLHNLQKLRRVLTEGAIVQEHLDRSHRIAIETALDAAIHDMKDHGVVPLPGEGDAPDA